MTARSGLALLLVSLLPLQGCGPAEWGTVAASDPAPDFALKDLGGRRVRLGDHRGKPVLVDFWATYCDTCRESIPELNRLHAAFNGRGLLVLGISKDAYTGHLRDFASEADMRYPVLMDPDQTVSRAYGVRKVPETFLVGRDGVVRGKWIGFKPGYEDEMKSLIEAELGKEGPTAPGARGARD